VGAPERRRGLRGRKAGARWHASTRRDARKKKRWDRRATFRCSPGGTNARGRLDASPAACPQPCSPAHLCFTSPISCPHMLPQLMSSLGPPLHCPLPPRFVLTLLVFSANRKRQTGRLGIGCWMRPRHRRGWRFAVRCCDGRMWVELQAQIWRMLLPLW
jgi:hypothetical protein